MIDDIDGLLAGFREDVPDMTDRAFDRGRVCLLARVAADPVTPLWTEDRPVRRAAPVRRRALPWLAAAAATTLAVAGGFVLTRDAARPAAPDTPLERLARNTSDPVQAPGQFLFMDRHEYTMSFVTRSVTQEGFWAEWVPADRHGVWQLSRDVDLSVADPPQPGESLTAMVSGLSQREGVFRAAGGDYFPTEGRWTDAGAAFVAGLPRDPVRLRQRLDADAVDPADRLPMVASVLSRPVPADLRRALFVVLAGLDVSVTDHARNRDGLDAVLISTTDLRPDTIVHRIYVDPADGELIGWRTELGDGRPLHDTTVRWSVVGSMGATS